MSYLLSNKYEFIKNIGEGTFGKVFKAKNNKTNELIAIKIQYKNISNVLKNEAKIYNLLSDVSGIPKVRNYGTEEGFHYLVLDLLGPSIADMNLEKLDTIKYLIDAINLIKFVHDRKLIHRDIKPDNFLLCEKREKLYLIDFGLTKYYLDGNNKHIPEKNDKKLIGTPNYCSINIHNGCEASRRDDLISLCYTFINIYGKILPWSKIVDRLDDNNKDEIYNNVKKCKEEFIDWLKDIPGEFITFLLYSYSLNYFDKPNYQYICNIFQNLLTINI